MISEENQQNQKKTPQIANFFKIIYEELCMTL